ncbi:extracellular calcium-sensing receptor-like [Hyperolius riggenbachi]|uniref:extracellular calcium-sensing receptor-like n=1 Tax=Hyperolius riggenbachi TaxID=752182 RepID=UPI0035A34946
MAAWEQSVLIGLEEAPVRPHLEYGIQFWAPHYRKDIAALEQVERRATKLIRGMEGLTYQERFSLESYHSLQALTFAVEEINQNPDILPNITLGFQVYDTCDVPHYEVQGAIRFLTKPTTDDPNREWGPCKTVLLQEAAAACFKKISGFSAVSLLSNRQKFPSFFRTIPSNKLQSKSLADLVLQFGWTWVGLLAADSDYGQSGIQPIKQEIIKAGGCVAFTKTIILGQPNRNAPHIVKTIKESTVTVIIAFAVDVDMVPIMDEMLKQNVYGKFFAANGGWSQTNLLSLAKYFPVVSGTVGVGLSSQVIVIKRKREMKKESPSPEILFPNPFHSSPSSLNVILPSSNSTLLTSMKGSPSPLLPYIRNVRMTLSSGKVMYFDENGDIPATYDIVNWQKNSDGSVWNVKVGRYDISPSFHSTFSINISILSWIMGGSKVPHSVCSKSCVPGFRKSILEGQPVCCFGCVQCLQGEISNQTDSIDCTTCPWDQWPDSQKTICVQKTFEFLTFEEPLGATLTAVGILSSLAPVFLLKMYIQHKHTPVIKANNYTLSCLLLVLLTLCFLCSLVFIGYPQTEKCLLRQTSFGLVFALCVSCILAKTIMVVLAFMATRPGSSLQKWATPQVSYFIIFTCFFLQFILCIIWLSLTPPFPQNNIQTKPGFIIVECNEGSRIAFWSMLGYLFLLATISFMVAFLARRLPDSFNEAQFITFSMLAFLSVWISFIPASLSAQGKYTVAMEIFAILASSWALVICMFLPKCFIILFRPDMNSRENLMGRTKNYDIVSGL